MRFYDCMYYKIKLKRHFIDEYRNPTCADRFNRRKCFALATNMSRVEENVIIFCMVTIFNSEQGEKEGINRFFYIYKNSNSKLFLTKNGNNKI